MVRSILPVLIALSALVGTLAALGCSGSEGGSFILPDVEDVREVTGIEGGGARYFRLGGGADSGR